jgi:hypothetical protein
MNFGTNFQANMGRIYYVNVTSYMVKDQYFGIFAEFVWAMESLITPSDRMQRVLSGTRIRALEHVPIGEFTANVAYVLIVWLKKYFKTNKQWYWNEKKRFRK